MTEQDIIFESGPYWVGRDRQAKQYVVYKIGVTHSVADSAYPMTDDGLSLATYRAKYLDKPIAKVYGLTYKGSSTEEGNAMTYESQMIQVLESKLVTEKARITYAVANNAPDCLISDYTKEAKRIERQISKYRKAMA